MMNQEFDWSILFRPPPGKLGDPAMPEWLTPLPVERWPLIARALARLSRDQDQGLGDTAQRYAAKFGGDLFKRIYKKLMGVECGCADRQARLNLRYPLKASATKEASNAV